MISYQLGTVYRKTGKHTVTCFPCNCVLTQLCLTLHNPMGTAAHQAPLSMGFPRKEYWSGLPFPFSADLPDLGTKPGSLTSPALAGGFFTTSATWEAPNNYIPLKLKKKERKNSNCDSGVPCVLTQRCSSYQSVACSDLTATFAKWTQEPMT